jgi:hypothetical protein
MTTVRPPVHTNRRSARLGGGTRLSLAIVGIGVWCSGAVWLVFHHWLVEPGEFGPQASPWEPWWLKWHGAFGFAAIWLFGLLWGAHVTAAWPLSRRRFSGAVLTGLLAWLVVSGYLLYYVGDDAVRSVVSGLHWGLGLAAPGAYAVHRVAEPLARAAPGRSRRRG